MKFTRTIGALALALGLGTVAAYAGGVFQNYPVLGASGTAYCSLYAGDGTTCVENTPAGPSVFSGTELMPADTLLPNGNQPQTVRVPMVALGTGPMVDLTTVGTANTIPNNTPYYFLDGAQGSALTVTMPARATEGQIQHVFCTAATVGNVTIAANTNQSIKNAPTPAACTAGTGWAWRYQASNTTWYRIQ